MKRKSKDPGDQRINKSARPTEPTAPWPLKSGMLEEVTLKNFMCHEKYHFRPNQRLNFLIGENGSGKSAILTAILFGLGGNARDSNRGNSNKGFIRTGQSSANVEIKICNRGKDTFKVDAYGGSIIISRTVSESTSTLKLKDAQGRVVQDKKVKEELDKILDHFNIQITNPMVILNQDASKTFLANSDSTKLYTFFHESTQLKRVENDYKEAASNLNCSSAALERKQSGMPFLTKEFGKWQKKLNQHDSIKIHQLDLEVVKAEHVWATITDCKTTLEDLRKRKERETQKSVQAKQCVDDLKEKDKEQRNKKKKVEAEIQGLADTTNLKLSKVNEAKQELADIDREVATIQRAMQNLEKKIQQAKSRLSDILVAIDKYKAGNLEFEEKRRARREQIEKYTSEIDAIVAQMTSSSNHLQHLRNNTHELEDQLKNLTYQVRSLDMKIKTNTDEIRELETGERNKLAAFGQWMPKLVAEIERNANRFIKKPIGPLGAFITIKEGVPKNEISIIETILGRLANSFCCDSHQDQKILFDIFCKLRLQSKPDILTSKFSDEFYKIDGKRVVSKYTTLIDCIDCNEPTVYNAVLDQAGLEKIIVINNNEEAQRILTDVRNVPRNLRYAVVESKYQYFPAPRYRSYYQEYRPRNLLKCSIEELIQEKKNVLIQLKEEKKQLESSARANQKKFSEVNRSISQEEQKINSIRKKKVEKQQIKQNLIIEEDAEQPLDIGALEDDEAHYKQRIDKSEKEIAEHKNKLVEIQQSQLEARKKAEEAEEDYKADIEKVAPLKQDLTKFEAAIKKCHSEINFYTGKIQEYWDKGNSFNKSITDKQTNLDELNSKFEDNLQSVRSASTDGSEVDMRRIKTKRSMAEVKAEIVKCHTKLAKLRDVIEPLDTVVTNHNHFFKAYYDAKNEMKGLDSMIAKLDTTIKIRGNGYKYILRSTAKTVARNFSIQLEVKGFIGVLDFNHTNRSLEVKVNPQDTYKAGLDVDRSLKSLSGGERSYTMISMILAFWEPMSPPFRILDEFDVFMDSVNRKIAVQNIIAFAKKDRKNQFIFLTPLSTDNIIIDEDIQILKLQKLTTTGTS